MGDYDDLRSRIGGRRAVSEIRRLFDIKETSDSWWDQIVLGILPEGTIVEGDLTFNAGDLMELEKQNFAIPDNVTIQGNLRLIGFSHMTELPVNLTVTGDLELRGAQLRRLPDWLHVGGILDLTGNAHPVEILPCTRVGMWMEGGK